ncbi:MAG: hypothetical protein ACOYD0_00755 [Candidatus Nanopelagicales bacterium]
MGTLTLLAADAFSDLSTFTPRYFVPFVPGLCLALGVGLWVLSKFGRPVPVLVLCLGVCLGWPAQVVARTDAANGGYDGAALLAAMQSPQLASTQVWPDASSFVMISSREPGFGSHRMKIVDQSRSSGNLVPPPVSTKKAKELLANRDVLVLTGVADSTIEGRTSTVARIGFAGPVLKCEGSYGRGVLRPRRQIRRGPRLERSRLGYRVGYQRCPCVQGI